MAGVSNEIQIDGVTLLVVADHTLQASEALLQASKRMLDVKRHDAWRCNQKYNVSNEVNRLVTASQRVSRYLGELSKMVRQGTGEIDATEKELRAGLNVTQTLTL